MTDLRDAIRALRSTPIVTTVAILSLALGIGANTAMFSILDSLSQLHPAETHEVVGYAQDAVYRNLRQTVPPTIFIPYEQFSEHSTGLNFSLRSASGSPALLTRSVADAFTRVTPDLSLTIRMLSEQVANSLIQERLLAILSGFFGALALLLAAIGLYAILTTIAMAAGAVPAWRASRIDPARALRDS